MRSILSLVTLLFITASAMASSINNENIVGVYEVTGSAFGQTRSFKLTLTADHLINIQQIHPENRQQDIKDPSRVCSGTYKLNFENGTSYIESFDVVYPDPDPKNKKTNIHFQVDFSNATIQDFERPEGTSMALKSDMYGFFTPTLHGKIKRVSTP